MIRQKIHMVKTQFPQLTGAIIPCFLGTIGGMVMPLSVTAQTIESIDIKPNDTFADRVIIHSETTRIYGALTPINIPQADYVLEGYLEAGAVDEFTWTDLTPGHSFFAWVTLEQPNVANVDPIMGLFGPDGEVLQVDDDSSPTAVLAPAILGAIADNGSLSLKVSGLGDEDFDGFEEYYYGTDWENEDPDESFVETQPHYQFGAYTLSVISNTALKGDVDFFTVRGLPPNHSVTITSSMSEGNIRLGWIAADGTVVRSSTYSNTSYQEEVTGIIPLSGDIHIAVSGYDDNTFSGQHFAAGEYVLRVEVEPLGE